MLEHIRAFLRFCRCGLRTENLLELLVVPLIAALLLGDAHRLLTGGYATAQQTQTVEAVYASSAHSERGAMWDIVTTDGARYCWHFDKYMEGSLEDRLQAGDALTITYDSIGTDEPCRDVYALSVNGAAVLSLETAMKIKDGQRTAAIVRCVLLLLAALAVYPIRMAVRYRQMLSGRTDAA